MKLIVVLRKRQFPIKDIMSNQISNFQNHENKYCFCQFIKCLFYNVTNCGVDIVDKISSYHVARNTKHWPLVNLHEEYDKQRIFLRNFQHDISRLLLLNMPTITFYQILHNKRRYSKIFTGNVENDILNTLYVRKIFQC